MINIKKELLWWLGCFVAAECVNLYAILLYHRPASELVSMIGYVIVISLVFYVVALVVRGIVHLCRKKK